MPFWDGACYEGMGWRDGVVGLGGYLVEFDLLSIFYISSIHL